MKKIKNTYILTVGLILVVVSYIISALYSMNLELKEPVFLENYYESDIQRRSVMALHLITNSNDNRQIVQIDFPQLPDDFAYASTHNVWNNNNGYDRINKFANYNYKVIYFEFININENLIDDEVESIVLDNAKIKYINGDTQYVDIGKIVLHKNLKSNVFFNTDTVSSSNNFSSKLYAKVVEDITINNIGSYFDDELEGFLQTTVNGLKQKDIQYPLSFKSGDYIDFSSSYLYGDPNDMRRYNVYDIKKVISITDAEGNEGYELLYNLDYEPTGVLSCEKEIIDYLKYRGVK